MAIIAQGELRLTGEPREAIASLDGRVWKKTVDKAALDEHFAAHSVLSSRLVAGQPVIHVLSDDNPGEGFAAVPPDLEDVYFGERSEEHTSELQSLMRISYAVFCLKQK